MDRFSSQTRFFPSSISRSGADSIVVEGETVFSGGGNLVGEGGREVVKNGRSGGRRSCYGVKDPSAPKEGEGKVQVGCGPERCKSLARSKEIQNGDVKENTLSRARESVGDIHRPQGRLLSYPCGRGISQVSRYSLQRQDAEIQNFKFRSLSSSMDFHQSYPSSSFNAKEKRNYVFGVFGRLHNPGQLVRRVAVNSRFSGASIVQKARFMYKRGERSAGTRPIGGILGYAAQSGRGFNLYSRKEERRGESRTEERDCFLPQRKISNSNEKIGKYSRSGGRVGSGTGSGQSIFTIVGGRDSGWSRRGSELGRSGEFERRGGERFGNFKEGSSVKYGKGVQSFRKIKRALHRRKLLRMGSIPAGNWLRKWEMVRCRAQFAHKLQRNACNRSCARIVPKKSFRGTSESNFRFNGGVLLRTKRWRQKESTEQPHQGIATAGNSPGHKTGHSRMDSHASERSRRSIQVDRSGRLDNLHSVFRVPGKFVQLRRKSNGGQVCGLKQLSMQAVQQPDVLPQDRSGRCFLSELGRGRSTKLVGSPSQVDPENPFVRKGNTLRGYNNSTRVEESVVVANAVGDAIGTPSASGRFGFCPWPEQLRRTIVEPFMAYFSLPDNWNSLSPKALRPLLVLKSHKHLHSEFPVDYSKRWAEKVRFGDYARSVAQLIEFAKESGLSPDIQMHSVVLLKRFLLHVKCEAVVCVHVQLLYSISKLWSFNPVDAALQQLGKDGDGLVAAVRQDSNASALDWLIDKGRSEATSKAYAREWNGYFSFAKENNRCSLKDHNTLCDYAATLWSRGMASKAISAINAVAKASVLLDWESSPAESPKVKEVKKALIRLRAEKTSEFKRDPLPAEAVVKFVLSVVEQGLQDEPYFQQCCLLLLVGFRLMLRSKSLAAVKVKHVALKDWGLEIAIAPVKTMQSWQRKHIEKSQDWKLCPVFWFNKFCETVAPDEDDFLFINPKTGGPISSLVITELVRKIADSSKIDGDFSSHSLRIGGATAAALGGLSTTQIQAIGGWESFAVLRYIRSLVGVSKNVSEKMGLVAPFSAHTSDSSV